MNRDEMISALDLKRVVNIDDVILKPDQVLMQSISPNKSTLILPDELIMSSNSMLKIIKVGDGVKFYKPGHIVLDWGSDKGFSYYYKGDSKFIMTDQYNIKLVVEEGNYDINK